MTGQRRSSNEWQQLLAEFDAGTETAATFCRSRGINSSNFYKRRMTRTRASSSAFVVARRAAPPSLQTSAPISVQINDVTIRCDSQVPVAWVSELAIALRG
ncbi:MAG: hypothetical protein AB8C02_12720 [Halioglobus sp.]